MGNAAGVESNSSSSSGGGASATVVPPRAINTTATLSPRDVDTLREKYEVTSEEIHLLFERFHILGPDENGLLSRRVFQKPPYSTDPFCRQLWGRLTGELHDSDKISFQSFVKTMAWWQKAPLPYKIELFYNWMKEEQEEGITTAQLARILGHVLPDESQEGLELTAEQIVDLMSSVSGRVSREDFMSWFETMPQERLKQVLQFDILNYNTRPPPIEH